ncbi:MAG TPA: Holliday junction branch migration protein RuvA [Candidatus Limiplasma sp.]|nr:Holliday junction branch migration protein RuvA [Candidatus Limiplasma sp.]HPS81668.1 Holliday junction branch migration protein RuvA [Candidatus Limiplasma sp.]
MIAVVEGKVIEKSEGEVILMAGGIGLKLICSMNTLAAIPPVDQTCRLFTHFSVREDAMDLYGFMTREERDMFRHLISVTSVGPKSAMFILGSLPLADLRLAILTGDIGLLSRAPGVGKKTAQRIALELKDTVTRDALASGISMEEIAVSDPEAPAQDALGEAIQALKALGYSPQEAANALRGVKGQAQTADEMIRLALRNMAQQA